MDEVMLEGRAAPRRAGTGRNSGVARRGASSSAAAWRAPRSLVIAAMVAATIAGLAGCGGDEPRHLTDADVATIPPGTATGTSFSGTYFADRADLDGCHCRLGPCSLLSANMGTTTVTQNGGVVSIEPVNPPLLTGGIDLDGRFSAGASADVDLGHGIELMEGTIHAQVSLDAVVESTFVAVLGDVTYDCDVRLRLHASYTGP